MTSLADKAILSGADNHPPMLEKDMYDSWKSRMELYMLNKQHGRMILESIENGPLLWPTVEEDVVNRLKKYSKLSAAEAIQADCDVKATNIILQGLHLEVYALFNTHKMIEYHLVDIRLKDLLVMVLVMHTEEYDMVLHMEKTGMWMLMVEIDVGGMTVDVVDKLICLSDVVQPRQVDLRYAHALIKLHCHDTHVDLDRHEVDQLACRRGFDEVLSWLFVAGYLE
nr:hypothetical protein [Tanacetum cinerariifolium]